MLGLGAALNKSKKQGLSVVQDNLVLRHSYDSAGAVHQVSTGTASFNGSSDHIDTGNHFSSTFDGNFSIAAWIKPDDGRPSANVNIVGAVDGSTDQIGVVLLTGGQIQFYMSADGDDGYVQSSAIFADGVGDWTHIACVATLVGGGNTTMKIYINGVEDNPTTSAIASSKHDDFSISETLYIGARNTNSTTDDFFDGYICNVGIWGAALSQADVKSIMWKNYTDLTTSEKSGSSLVSWWNLDEETNTSGAAGTGGVKDYHGSNHGTLA